MSDVKITSTCKECGVKFELSAKEMEWYRSREFEIPRRCLECRNKRKLKARERVPMNEDQKLIYLRGQILCAEIEMQGMLAENKQREAVGASMAYVESDFQMLFSKYAITHNAILHEFFPSS